MAAPKTRVKNLARGGGVGGTYKEGITGLKDLERKLKAMRTDNPSLMGELKALTKAGADEVRDQMRASAINAGWGSAVFRGSDRKTVIMTGQAAIDAIFSSTKGTETNSRARINALAGVSKRHSMIEWKAGPITAKSKPTRTPRKKNPGEMVAESAATMLEFGTTVRDARPALRSAIELSKARIITRLAEGMNALLTKYSA